MQAAKKTAYSNRGCSESFFGPAATKLRDVIQQHGSAQERTWSLLGKRVGFKCVALILGVGRGRLRAAIKGAVDQRFSGNNLELLQHLSPSMLSPAS